MEIKIVIKSRRDSLPYVIDMADGIMARYGLRGEDASRMMLVIDEAVVNSINYAYEDGEEGDIVIVFGLEEEKFFVTVEDFGRGMNLKNRRIYDVEDMTSISAPNGRGVFLMQTLTDEFEIDSLPNKGTRIYMAKYILKQRCVANG